MATTTSVKTNKASNMEELLAAHEAKVQSFKKYQKIDASFLRTDKTSVAYFDVDGKSDAILEGEFFNESKDYVLTLKPGDKVRATVMEPETKEGNILISLRDAALKVFWEMLEKAQKEGTTITVTGRSATERGIVVVVDNNVTAFIPISQLGKELAENPEELVGEKIKVKVLDVDQRNDKIVLSERAVSEQAEIEQMKKALDAIKEGQEYEGTVKKLTSFGAFVEIMVKDIPVEGLVHISELSWGKVEKSSSVLAVGQTVKVIALGVDEDDRLALSIKQTRKDPWKDISSKYTPDQRLKGAVTRMSDFGAFVELEPGVEGLIHITKIPPGTILEVGQDVNVYIEEVNEIDRRISLGIVLTAAKPVGYK